MPDTNLPPAVVHRSLIASEHAGIVPEDYKFLAEYLDTCVECLDMVQTTVDEVLLAILEAAMWREQASDAGAHYAVVYRKQDGWHTEDIVVRGHDGLNEQLETEVTDFGTDLAAALLHSIGVEVVR